jgi:hypothetical protein
LRAKLGPLVEAFCGFFTDQHAFLLAKMLGRVDALDADLAELDAKLAELIAPFTDAVDRLDEVPGLGRLATHLLIAELGADMTRFPTCGCQIFGHLMRPAHTHGSAHRVDLVARRLEPAG